MGIALACKTVNRIGLAYAWKTIGGGGVEDEETQRIYTPPSVWSTRNWNPICLFLQPQQHTILHYHII
jgi:hypothetical protein